MAKNGYMVQRALILRALANGGTLELGKDALLTLRLAPDGGERRLIPPVAERMADEGLLEAQRVGLRVVYYLTDAGRAEAQQARRILRSPLSFNLGYTPEAASSRLERLDAVCRELGVTRNGLLTKIADGELVVSWKERPRV